jgi:hypothetical protein
MSSSGSVDTDVTSNAEFHAKSRDESPKDRDAGSRKDKNDAGSRKDKNDAGSRKDRDAGSRKDRDAGSRSESRKDGGSHKSTHGSRSSDIGADDEGSKTSAKSGSKTSAKSGSKTSAKSGSKTSAKQSKTERSKTVVNDAKPTKLPASRKKAAKPPTGISPEILATVAGALASNPGIKPADVQRLSNNQQQIDASTATAQGHRGMVSRAGSSHGGAEAEDDPAGISITTADVSVLRKLRDAIAEHPGRKGKADASMTASSAGTGTHQESGASSQNPAGGPGLAPQLFQVHGLMLRYILERVAHDPGALSVFPGRLPDPSCFFSWGDWRGARQAARRQNPHTEVRLPHGVAPVAVAEALVMRTPRDRFPTLYETKAMLHDACKRAAASMMMEAPSLPEQALLHGMIAHARDTDCERLQGPVACLLASEIGLLLGMRCCVHILRLEPHPTEPFSTITATIATERAYDAAQIMFRPILAGGIGSDAQIWFVRTGQEKRQPPRAVNARPPVLSTTARVNHVALNAQVVSAIRDGGKVGVDTDALLKSVLLAVASEIKNDAATFVQQRGVAKNVKR